MPNNITNNSVVILDVKSLVKNLDCKKNPFLFFLPEIIENEKLQNIKPDDIELFVRAAIRTEKSIIIKDALFVLNRIIDPENGNFLTPTKEIFYGNEHFFWNELGNNTKPEDIILHIMNKVIFFLKVSQNY